MALRAGWVTLAIVTGALGFVVGALVRLPADRKATNADLEQLSTADLGERLMGRVGRRFIADSRGKSPLRHGVSFYSQPKPYGHSLCRVELVSIPAKIVTGRIEQNQDRWANDVEVTTLYAVWTRPTRNNPKRPAVDRHRACAAFRDFDALFSVDAPGSAERGAWLTDLILDRVKAGKPGFALYCVDEKETLLGKPCDARAVLAPLTLRSLGSIQTVSGPASGPTAERVDRLYFPTGYSKDGHPTAIDLTVTSKQRVGYYDGTEGEVLSVEVIVSKY